MRELPAPFGKYFLTEKIATGGMAELYLAKLIGPGGFEKQLVIKQIHPALSDQRPFLDMFVAEAKTLVSLSHGNIVPVYELGEVDRTYFIAMEYIDGPPLARVQEALARRGAAMEPALAAYICAEILEGLDYAHRKGEGVIHRDLSPRNVMLSREGEVKLVDFGIAVTLGQGTGAAGTMPVGSYPYMSPEQVRGAALTAQSDLFSAGVLLWEMLAGLRLFARDSAKDTLDAVTGAVIERPGAHRAGIPAALDEMCMRALARDPAERYPSAAAWLAEVHRYLYSLAEPVSAVALSGLVARLCPPEVVRASASISDDVAAAGPGAEGTGTRPLAREPARREDGTVPLPGRKGNGRGGDGEQRDVQAQAGTERTFATHVALTRVLGGGADADAVQLAQPTAKRPTVSAADADADSDADPGAEQLAQPTAKRPTLAAAVAILAVSVSLIAGASVMLARREAASRALIPPARNVADAGAMALHRPGPQPESPPARPARTAAIPDAGAAPAEKHPHRPQPPPPRDPRPAGGNAGRELARGHTGQPSRGPAPDTATTGQPDTRAPAAPGTLKVGANPWGEVYLDGAHLGRAPNAWSVPAGAHTVEVILPLGDQTRRRRFSVTIEPGQTESLGVVDFTDELP